MQIYNADRSIPANIQEQHKSNNNLYIFNKKDFHSFFFLVKNWVVPFWLVVALPALRCFADSAKLAHNKIENTALHIPACVSGVTGGYSALTGH